MPDRTEQSPPDGRYVVFDLETLYLSHEVRGGWRNIRDFGLAVGVTIDEHGRQHVWQEPDAQDLIDYLAEHPRVVGFNSRRFDLTVLSAYGDVSVCASGRLTCCWNCSRSPAAARACGCRTLRGPCSGKPSR